MDRVKIFISSPGDVAGERQRALAVVERLQVEFNDKLSLEPLLWEQEPLLATADFQSQIRSPADFDIFVTIIGSRLGSPLGSQFTRRDGTPYASGTEFEFEIAVASHLANGRPELLFYRKPPPSNLPAKSQLEQVSAFFDKWFPNDGDGSRIGGYHSFPETDQFEQLFAEHLRALLRRFLPRPNNLPTPISSFLGRVDLVHEVSGLVIQDDVRLINLVGRSGAGKSRLGLRILRGLLADFQDGVFLVNLGYSGEEHVLPRAIETALEISPDADRSVLDGVVDTLRSKQMLLLVDNVEPVESVMNDLKQLLANCPGVTILATSVEALPVDDARIYSVPPLALPDLDTASFSDIRDSECVQLFVDRAQVAREDFQLTEENARPVLEICHQLGGLPLPVELAASRMRSMNINKMLRSLASIKVKDDSGNTVYLVPR